MKYPQDSENPFPLEFTKAQSTKCLTWMQCSLYHVHPAASDTGVLVQDARTEEQTPDHSIAMLGMSWCG
jgi:hypothetical protein